MTDDNLFVRCHEHTYVAPGVALCTSGRVFVREGDQVLIFPAPAAEIYRDMEARKTVRALELEEEIAGAAPDVGAIR